MGNRRRARAAGRAISTEGCRLAPETAHIVRSLSVVRRAVRRGVVLLGGVNAIIATAIAGAETGDLVVPTVRVDGAAVEDRTGLRNEVAKVESISAKEIARVNAANVLQAIEGRPGMSVQIECSICNVRNVVLGNLPGRFTTLSIDGVPLFSSLSNAYGLDSVGINGIERIDIARGAGASLVVPEALGGSVNLVTRRPTRNEATLQLQGGSYGERRADLFLAKPFEGGAVTAQGTANDHDSVDGNGNGISEYTGYRRRIGGAALHLDDVGGFRVRGRLDVIDEDRAGGAIGASYDAIRRSLTGNPFDFSGGRGGSPSPGGWRNPSTGAYLPYNRGLAGFSEVILTDRVQTLVTGERRVGTGQLRIAAGHARHRQDSFYEGDYYDARQEQSYASVNYGTRIGETLVETGVDYRLENLRSRSVVGGIQPVEGIDNYVYRVPAFTGHVLRTALDDKLEISAAIRIDRHNVFHRITSPRVALLYRHDDAWNSRFALGRGYRAPTSFFEQDHGILQTTRVLRLVDKVERSDNVGYALSLAGDRFSGVFSVSYNRIHDMALLDPDACQNASGALVATSNPGCVQPVTAFQSAASDTRIAGWDITTTWRMTPLWDLTTGFEDYYYGFTPAPLFAGGTPKSPLVFARPRNRAYLRTDYEAHGWNLLARATWTGPMDLARFYDYGSTPRFNLDGTPKLARSPSFWTVDLTARYRVDKRLSVLVGVTNLFDFRQTDREDYLWINAAGHADVTHIWGPNIGRQLYAGARLDL
jgi:outer membrane receptor for ferrienterochelin and colicins